MKKAHAIRSGAGKLLDAWSPPDDAGDPIGCVATSFTFSASFFEEECLARFLALEMDASEAPTAYLIEREEKLSKVVCAAALVDQHHVRSTRSLRWDLLAARLPSGILHAKVSLLVWGRHVRLIVASANLTEMGYRLNHEVFAVLDYAAGSTASLLVLDELIEFLRESGKLAMPGNTRRSPAVVRWNQLLDQANALSREWGVTARPRAADQPHVFALLSGPQRSPILEQIGHKRDDQSPLHSACVVSPFFDDATKHNQPAFKIWSLLKQRGGAVVEYHVTAEEVLGEDALLLHVPDVSGAKPDNRELLEIQFKQLQLEDDRPLHAKCLWFENERTILHVMGSSNFTSTGLGIGKVKNVEANLCFEVHRERQPQSAAALTDAWLPLAEFPTDMQLRFAPRPDDEDDPSGAEDVPLPTAFVEAIYSLDDQQRGQLDFVFDPAANDWPAEWMLSIEDSGEQFVSEDQWRAAGSPSTWRVAWQRERPPSGFEVVGSASTSRAWWPVNVQSSLALPPPNELKDLPLEVLIEILTSAAPLYQILDKWRERLAQRAGTAIAAELDPHRRVDTSGFLLQRTRRVSWALNALRERLERPLSSEQALHWRLRGPVGVQALAKAMSREAKSITERQFLLAELSLELHRVQLPPEVPRCLPTAKIRAAIRDVILELQQMISESFANGAELDASAAGERAAVTSYVQTVFKKVLA